VEVVGVVVVDIEVVEVDIEVVEVDMELIVADVEVDFMVVEEEKEGAVASEFDVVPAVVVNRVLFEVVDGSKAFEVNSDDVVEVSVLGDEATIFSVVEIAALVVSSFVSSFVIGVGDVSDPSIIVVSSVFLDSASSLISG